MFTIDFVQASPPSFVVANLVVVPMMPTIPKGTPLGATVAIIMVTMSDGSAVPGSLMLGFGPPFFDDGGVFSLSGSGASWLLLLNPSGPGVGSDGGTVQKVNVIRTA